MPVGALSRYGDYRKGLLYHTQYGDGRKRLRCYNIVSLGPQERGEHINRHAETGVCLLSVKLSKTLDGRIC